LRRWSERLRLLDRWFGGQALSQAQALVARGKAAERDGNLDDACRLYREAARLAPRHAPAHFNLGIVLESLGDTAGAAACHEEALALDPTDTFAAYNAGRLLYARGELGMAERRLAAALRAQPRFFEARVMLAGVRRAQARLEDAAAELEHALGERPAHFGALFNYAEVLAGLGRHEPALAALERALSVEPDNLDARFLYATSLMRVGREPQAEAALRSVIGGAPDFALAYRMLGSLLHREGRIAEMLALCRAALERVPNFEIESFELFLLNFSDELDDNGRFERHRDFGARLEAALPPRFAVRRDAGDAERRLRIGYVSGELNAHPVGLFLEPVLERHDRARFEVCCYSTSTKADAFTRKLRAHSDLWREASGLSAEELSDAVHADRIDILVDLSGHSGISRLATFARRPAPVQAAWLGYLNTTGLTRIGYRISDAVCDPPGTERWHTETVLRLPNSQWCYRPFLERAPAETAPCLARGHVTFGSFAQVAKLSPRTLSLWTQILGQVPEARLVVAGVPPGRGSDRLRHALAAVAERVEFLPFLPLADYYDAFAGVDIALDPMPYSGGTTTCDALWMGVPVLTAPGRQPASRSAASILTTAGLDEWIAPDAAQYVSRAVSFGRQGARLAELRATLRARLRGSALMDEARFVADLERLFRDAWRKHCLGQDPRAT
jgi:predicted O-linked N-acetylglucosamine transferase (SPINDLY family)